MDLSRFAASEAIIEMRAYYKIAKDTFVDNFSQLAIEDCLISQIPELFSPEKVADLDDDTIGEIAMETESAAWERGDTDSRLELCLSALDRLKRIENMRASAVRLDISDLPPNSGSEDAEAGAYSYEQGDRSLSKLDPALSEFENEESLANEVAENEGSFTKGAINGVELLLSPRRKGKGLKRSDDDWLRS